MSKKVMIFSSATCAPCRQVKPELVAQAATRGFQIEFVDMAISNQEVFAKHDVRAVPTVICMDDDQEVGRFSGAQTPAAIGAKLTEWGL